MAQFKDLLTLPALHTFVKDEGFKYPTKVQAASIPRLLSGKSLSVLAQTGSGKTLAYALPIVELLKQREDDLEQDESPVRSPVAWVLCPTIELGAQVEQVFKSVDTPRPIQITATPDKSGRLFLVLQEGKVLLLGKERGNSSSDVILDLTGLDLIDNAFEEGLLGLAFHPECAKNNLFYIYHTLQNPKRSVLVERKFSDLKSFSVDQKYQREILSILQPYWNHNSGIPVFGPDGFLYLSTGDGGSANDPHNHSQNTFSLLGKVLRIDVDSQVGSLPYKIPADNPFVGKPGYRGEIWAYGLRNPWLLHWDMRQER